MTETLRGPVTFHEGASARIGMSVSGTSRCSASGWESYFEMWVTCSMAGTRNIVQGAIRSFFVGHVISIN
jgi:hypothetical protein